MNTYITISSLNDYLFCPYSLYLHNIYAETDDGIYHAKPQTQGKLAHISVDNKTASTRKGDLLSLPVYSEKYQLMGKIDIYRKREKLLIERKYHIKKLYRGNMYQIWAQYLCMKEMGYDVERLAFYDISTNKMIPVSLPTKTDILQLTFLIDAILWYDPTEPPCVSVNKCRHCIYCSLCDKTEEEYVYE